MNKNIYLILAMLALLSASCSKNRQAVVSDNDSGNNVETAVSLQTEAIGNTKNVHSFGNVYLAGQFHPDDIPLLKERGIQTVITLRTDGEVKWDEQKMLEEAGIEFIQVPFSAPDTLTDAVFDAIRDLMKKNQDRTVMLHCGSANRVGAVWAAVRACDGGLDTESALTEARKVGLRTAGLAEKAENYISRHSEPSITIPDN